MVSLLILFGRIYLGVHSIDQVIFGCLLGITLLVYYQFVLKEPMLRYARKLMTEKLTKAQAMYHILTVC